MQVRRATTKDMSQLVDIEATRWGRIPGAPPLDEAFLQHFFDYDSPYFLVAIADGKMLGYNFSVPFEFGNTKEEWETFKNDDQLRTYGIAKVKGHPQGQAVYASSVTCISPEAAGALHQATANLIRQGRHEYLIGVSRLGIFKHYWKKICTQIGHTTPEFKLAVASWYAEESIRLAHRKPRSAPATINNIVLPPLERPDVVVAHNVNGVPFELAEVLEMIPDDVNGCGVGAAIISRWPHELE